VAESNLHPEQEGQKRRSTRIVQAVPLTVTGVDALGRPFQERTSTLTINCQGCRYQSKHYVLKNMWITLEIPHNAPGRPPRSVRGRVTWVQRPRTVRELFQIAVELEVSGNVWGIAFPPGDWFPFPDSESETNVEVPAQPEVVPSPPEAISLEPETRSWQAEEAPSPRERESVEDNVRVLPITGSNDASLQLSRQVTRLLTEAQEQIQSTLRQSANEAVSAEIRQVVADLHTQLIEAAQKSVADAIASQIEDAKREALQHQQNERDGILSALRDEMALELKRQIGEARGQIDDQFAEIESARQAEFELRIQNELHAAIQRVENVTRALAARENEARLAMEQMRLSSEQATANELRLWQEQMDQRSADAQQYLTQMEQAAKSLREQIAATTTIGEVGWRGALDSDMESATQRWREKMETLAEDASRLATEKFGKNAAATVERSEEHLQQQIAAIGNAQSQVAAEADDMMTMLRAAINQEVVRGEATCTQLEQAAAQLEGQRSEFAARLETASENLAQRGQAILEAQNDKLARQAEAIMAGTAERFQFVLEASGRGTVDKLLSELDERLATQMARVDEAASKLVFDHEQAEKILAEHQARVWQASDRNLQDTVARGKELLAQIETEFRESAREVISKFVSELESKATETSQATFEALFKSADWYEKKVQNQMQATLQKGTDQAAAQLREKAAELSGVFARELDHVSRSYVEHAQGQIQESASAAVEHASQQVAETGDAAGAKFYERAGQIGQQRFEEYQSKTKTAFEQNAAYMEANAAQVRGKLESDARGFAVEFQRTLSQHLQQTMAHGIRELGSQIEQARNNLVHETQSLQRQFRSSLEPLGAAAIDEHKKRLENTSNAWLVTTVTKLTQQAQSRIEELANSTEKKLKEVCAAVISDMGTSLRQRLAGLGGPGSGPASPASAPPSIDPTKEQK